MNNGTRVGLGVVGLALAAVSLAPNAQQSAGQPGALKPQVSVMELMQETITPATNQLWSAYKEPSTPAEWRMMEEASITLLAAASLTAAGGTGPMDNNWAKEPAWQGFNAALIDARRAALEASRKQDQEGLLAAGDLLLPPCEGCHQQFNPAVVNAQ